MSTKSLSGLVDYLCGTLSREDMLFVSQKLSDCAMEQADEEPLPPYTKEEMNAMLDEAEERFAQGIYYTNEEVFREWDEHRAARKRRKQMMEEQTQYAEAV